MATNLHLLAAVYLSATAHTEVTRASLVQAFEDGRSAEAYSQAKAILERGDASGPEMDTARLAAAFAALRLGRADWSRQALTDVAANGPDLGPYLVYLRSLASAAAGDCAQATELVESLPDGSVFAPLGWPRVIRCEIDAGEFEAASASVDAFEALAISDRARAEVTLWRARLAESQRNLAAATDLYREVLVNYPLTAAGRAARDALDELKRRGVRVKPLLPEELLPLADGERSQQQAKYARRIYRTVVHTSSGEKRADVRHQAELGLCELDIVDRHYPRALNRLDRVLGESEDPSLRARALYLRGDVLSRLGRGADAIDSFINAKRESPTAPYALGSALAAAQLCYQQGEMERARELVGWVLKQDQQAGEVETLTEDGLIEDAESRGRTVDEARWLLVWIEHSTGAGPATLDNALARIDAAGTWGTAALYWRTRLAAEVGDLGAAEEYARELAERSPTSFYALAANDLLRQIHPTCRVDWTVPVLGQGHAGPLEAPSVPPSDLRGSAVLFAYGFESEARRTLQTLSIPALSAADKVVAAWLYRRCGDVHRAAILTRRPAEGTQRDVQDPVLLQLAYPRPFDDIVTDVAARQSVPADLIYAVMREESAFDPRAISPRRAMGLMQLLTMTARRMAANTELRHFRTRQLLDPPVSIELGARYLAALLGQFDGDLVSTIAAYHAGEQAVERWRKKYAKVPADEFIEQIPYDSTRAYVKHVLASYGIYRVLYGGQVDQAIGLPYASLALTPSAMLNR